MVKGTCAKLKTFVSTYLAVVRKFFKVKIKIRRKLVIKFALMPKRKMEINLFYPVLKWLFLKQGEIQEVELNIKLVLITVPPLLDTA